MKHSKQSGQIGLVVLLIMTTMLTVGIGAISRSTTDLRITRQELEASQAFNAAEAGVEAALGEIESGITFVDGEYANTITVDGDIPVNYNISEMRDFQTQVQENQTLFINVDRGVPYSGEELTITFARGQDGCSDNPASLVIKQYSRTGPVITQAHAKCNRDDGFIEPSGTVGIFLRPDDVYVAVRPVYADTIVEGSTGGGWTLPVQAYEIESRATLPETDETRVVVLHKTVEMPPDIFSYALVSGTTILMN